MRTFNRNNTENVKQERKKSKELRKLRMNSGYTLAWEESLIRSKVLNLVLTNSMNTIMKNIDMKTLIDLFKLYINLFKKSWRL